MTCRFIDSTTKKFIVQGPDLDMHREALEDHESRIAAIDAGTAIATPGTVEASKAVTVDASKIVTGLKYPVTARTVTADGTGTGTIPDNLGGLSHVTVTSDDANKILVLPTPVVGQILVIHGPATGFELRSSSPTTIAINGGTGSAAESAIAANSTLVMICVTSTAWKGYFLDADSDLAKVEAAAP